MKGTVKVVEEKLTKPADKKLGLRALVKVEARVRSGCTRYHTHDCGINYRQG